jgi:hypothetical protein
MPSSYAIGDHFEQFIKHQVQAGATPVPAKSCGTPCGSRRNRGWANVSPYDRQCC